MEGGQEEEGAGGVRGRQVVAGYGKCAAAAAAAGAPRGWVLE